jgi:hypothetical protein
MTRTTPHEGSDPRAAAPPANRFAFDFDFAKPGARQRQKPPPAHVLLSRTRLDAHPDVGVCAALYVHRTLEFAAIAPGAAPTAAADLVVGLAADIEPGNRLWLRVGRDARRVLLVLTQHDSPAAARRSAPAHLAYTWPAGRCRRAGQILSWVAIPGALA